MARDRELRRLSKEYRGGNPVTGSALLFLILVFIATAVYWAHVTEIDDVTRAGGKIIPSSQNQVVQAPETGILRALYVKKGDVVEEGQVLMVFDGTGVESELNRLEQKLFALQVRSHRLEAEIEGRDLSFPVEIKDKAGQITVSETALFEARRVEFASELDVLQKQFVQREQELREWEADLAAAQETLALVDSEYDLIAPLVEKNLEPETSLLALKRSRAEWQGRITRARATMVRLTSGIEESRKKIEALKDRRRAKMMEEYSRTIAELEELQPLLNPLRQRQSQAELIAPTRGIVNQIMLTTIGGVAQVGAPMVEIVSLDDTMLVEAYVSPTDIAFLHSGQKVRVKLTAYDFSRYGSMEGHIVRIGADVITLTATKDSVYVVEIETETTLTDAAGRPLDIIPGMIAEVDILSEKKTVLDYITRPVVRVKNRALRD
jgi:adhesin transport system membrane fusion protein